MAAKDTLEARARALIEALDRMHDGPCLSHNVCVARDRLRDVLPRVTNAGDKGKAKVKAA